MTRKKNLSKWAKNFNFIKINKKEYDYQENKRILNSLPLIVTLGKDGCFYKENVYKYKEAEMRNQAGLGDVFLAGFVTEYLRSKDIGKACMYANKASFCAASRKGVTVVSNKDILKLNE